MHLKVILKTITQDYYRFNRIPKIAAFRRRFQTFHKTSQEKHLCHRLFFKKQTI